MRNFKNYEHPFDIKNQENESMKAPTEKYAPSLKNIKRAVCTSGLLT